MIGAGVIGAAIAQHLASRGLAVTVVDGARGVGGGCSYANAALVAPDHVSPLATPSLLRALPGQMLRRPPAVRVRARRDLAPWLLMLAASAYAPGAPAAGRDLRALAMESAELHRELASSGVSPDLRKTGALDVYLRPPRRPPEGFLTPEEAYRVEPTLAPVAGGTHASEEWTIESRGFVTSMLQSAAEHGAKVMFDTPVEHLLLHQGRAVGVRTPRATLRSDHVVLAAGLGSIRLAAQAGLRLPLQGGRGHGVDLNADQGGPSLPIRIKEHRVVVTPLADRVRVSGALEFGTTPAPGDHRRSEALRQVAAAALPELDRAEVIERWSGERPCTSDGLPAIGRSGRVAGLSVATGHGMWGLVLAPVTARLVAGGLEGDQPPAASGLSPDRFSPRRHRSERRTPVAAPASGAP